MTVVISNDSMNLLTLTEVRLQSKKAKEKADTLSA